MPLAISVVGRSHSGKTTILERLIGELKRRGYHLAAIKHSSSDLDLDHAGKDSWRLAKAGSDTVVVSSPRQVGLFKAVEREVAVGELLKLAGDDFDIILVEGFKESDLPKIEVHRKEVGGLLFSPDELLAVVSEEPLDIAVPRFSPDEVESLADFVEQKSRAWREAGEGCPCG